MIRSKCLCMFFIACMIHFYIPTIGNDIVQVRFNTDDDVPGVTPVNNKLVMVSFRDETLRNIFSTYTIEACVQSYPMVLNIPHPLAAALNRVYEFVLPSGGLSLMQQLKAFTGSSIVNVYLLQTPEELMLPNDYNSDVVPCGSSAQALRHLELIGARDAWNITTGSPDVRIAVLDNGFNKNHEDLAGKIANAGTHTGFETHGTVVLGHVAAHTNNGKGQSAIGYDCQLLAYETGLKNFPQAILAGAKVINCSWYTGCSFNQNDQHMIDIAHDMGVVVVAAAGNGGTCGGPDNYVYPASYDRVISVTGVGHYFPRNETDPCNGKINYEDVHLYRARNGAAYQTLQHNDKVDLAAPAYEVRSLSLSSYWNVSGSSYSAPIVSGVCGLLFSISQDFTPGEIEGILKCSADNIDTISMNAPFVGKLGAGRLNAHAAVLKGKRMVDNRPADIRWYYYNKRGIKVYFNPDELYLHIRAAVIAGNTIFAEAVSKLPAMNFDWEFRKDACTIRKSGNPVSIDLGSECPAFWYTMTAKVKNKVPDVCDPQASVYYREVVRLDESEGCVEPYRTTMNGNIAIPGVTLPAKHRPVAPMIVPNPFRATFNIRNYQPATDLKCIQIINTAGQIVWTRMYTGNAPANIRIDLRQCANGIYFVKLVYASRIITERIVKRL